MAEMKYWLWLSGEPRLSPRAKAAVIRHYSDPELAFMAPVGEFAGIPGLSAAEAAVLERRDLSRVEAIASACREQGIDIITMQDAAYPKRLKNIFDPPVVLYVKGRLPELEQRPAIAVIGTRKASPYGLKMGRSLAYEISKCGGIVISGLTEGIDRAAAIGCLQAGGCCIGVLGRPHGNDNALQRDVIASGALISEYPPGMESRRGFYRERNRIASGLSHGVVVVEAPEDSGALLFASVALEQGREIFAVPGNADAHNSVGSIGLIKQGAKPVTCGWDAVGEFEYLFPGKLHELREKPQLPPAPEELVEKVSQSAEKPVKRPASAIKDVDKEKQSGYIGLREQLAELSEEQLLIIDAIGDKETHIDDIIQTTGLSTAKVLSQLTVLEIKSYIRRSAGRRFSLNIKSK